MKMNLSRRQRRPPRTAVDAFEAARRADHKAAETARLKRDNAWGVDAPMDRMALALIYLWSGALPAGFNEDWKDELPLLPRPKGGTP